MNNTGNRIKAASENHTGRVMNLLNFFSDKVAYEMLCLRTNHLSSQRIEDRRSFRLTQFVAARASAKRLFRALGLPSVEISRRPDGSPDWPSSVVGSIAHSNSHVFVAIARREDLRGLG